MSAIDSSSSSPRMIICEPPTRTGRRLSSIGQVFAALTVEPALFVYMISSYLHFPVFQALIYEKSCLDIYDGDLDLCTNDSATHRDQSIQTRANFVFMLSSVCLTIPSFIATIFLGSYGDRRSRKLALLLPYVGLILADVGYILQATYYRSNVYWLLICDCVFGTFGGYSSIIGTSFSYGAQSSTNSTNRSYRMAILEGCIGAGGTIGYLLSGILLNAVGYRYVFLIDLILHVVCFAYLLARTSDTMEQIERRRRRSGRLKCIVVVEDENGGGEVAMGTGIPTESSVEKIMDTDGRDDRDDGTSGCWWLWTYFRDALSVLRPRSGGRRIVIALILAAFSVSYLVFSGSQDIMFYYLKHELLWNSATYGIFRAVYFGSSSAMILIIFPLLKYWGVNDWILAAIGLTSRMIGSLMLCFPFSTWFVFCVSIFYMFNRFAATGMRSIASKQVEKHEQGKLFAAIALIEAICTLFASVIFNNMFSWSLSFYAGFCYVLMTVLMLVPLSLIFVIGYRLRRADHSEPTIS